MTRQSQTIDHSTIRSIWAVDESSFRKSHESSSAFEDEHDTTSDDHIPAIPRSSSPVPVVPGPVSDDPVSTSYGRPLRTPYKIPASFNLDYTPKDIHSRWQQDSKHTRTASSPVQSFKKKSAHHASPSLQGIPKEKPRVSDLQSSSSYFLPQSDHEDFEDLSDQVEHLTVDPVPTVERFKTYLPLQEVSKYSRFFIIKSFTETDIQRAARFNIWTSTELGNARLNSAWRQRAIDQPIYLFFSVNSSGRFCAMAELVSGIQETDATIWTSNRWKGHFQVIWHYFKDIPNAHLRGLRNSITNRSVTHSRDTQEVDAESGVKMFTIFRDHQTGSSILEALRFS